MSRRPTQRELAARLGLSPATVSLAMRDSPMIAEETRRLVQAALREAGYVQNRAAAALRTGRTRIVGVSFHNIAHQFFAEMLIAIEESLGRQGIVVFLNNHGEKAESLARFVDSLAAYGAEGLLVSPPPDVTAEIFAPIRRMGVPLVYVSRHLRGRSGGGPDRQRRSGGDAARGGPVDRARPSPAGAGRRPAGDDGGGGPGGGVPRRAGACGDRLGGPALAALPAAADRGRGGGAGDAGLGRAADRVRVFQRPRGLRDDERAARGGARAGARGGGRGCRRDGRGGGLPSGADDGAGQPCEDRTARRRDAAGAAGAAGCAGGAPCARFRA